MQRPEYIKCIARDHSDFRHQSWCGRDIQFDFAFDGLGHAAENGRQEGRLIACKECVAEAVKVLNYGHAEPERTVAEGLTVECTDTGLLLKPDHSPARIAELYKGLADINPERKVEPVAWMIDWPDEPELGNYFSDAPNEYARSRPLYLAPIGQWIPVSERLPEKGVLVLVYTPPCYGQEESSTGLDLIDPSSDGDVWLIHSESYEHYCAVSDGINCTGPDETAPYTHWMPLPAAPKEQSDEQQ